MRGLLRRDPRIGWFPWMVSVVVTVLALVLLLLPAFEQLADFPIVTQRVAGLEGSAKIGHAFTSLVQVSEVRVIIGFRSSWRIS